MKFDTVLACPTSDLAASIYGRQVREFTIPEIKTTEPTMPKCLTAEEKVERRIAQRRKLGWLK